MGFHWVGGGEEDTVTALGFPPLSVYQQSLVPANHDCSRRRWSGSKIELIPTNLLFMKSNIGRFSCFFFPLLVDLFLPIILTLFLGCWPLLACFNVLF